MKSAEIKSLSEVVINAGAVYTKESNAAKPSRPLSLDEMNTLFLGEIAYQFAILNEHLATVDAHVFGDQLRKKDK